MDELSRIWFRTECRDRLHRGVGTAFQDLFADIMELAYPKDFQRIRPYGNQGDQKCDGRFPSALRRAEGAARDHGRRNLR